MAAGLPRTLLRRVSWERPAHGLYTREDAADLKKRCRSLALVLPPGAIFTHLTAAQLRGWWLPWPSAAAPIIACSDSTAAHHDRRGVYVRRCATRTSDREDLGSLSVSTADRTLVELSEDLALIDLVVAMDSALAAGACSVDSLTASCVRGRRGVRNLRRAIALSDARSESAWETILRLVHTLSGIGDVEPQYVVTDLDGRFVARADLRLGRTMRLHEYDGAVHRERDQHRADLAREKALSRLGWQRFGYTAIEVHTQPGKIVADAETALGLTPDPSRVAGWLYEYERSSLSEAGVKRLRRRLRRFERSTPPRSIRRPNTSA